MEALENFQFPTCAELAAETPDNILEIIKGGMAFCAWKMVEQGPPDEEKLHIIRAIYKACNDELSKRRFTGPIYGFES